MHKIVFMLIALLAVGAEATPQPDEPPLLLPNANLPPGMSAPKHIDQTVTTYYPPIAIRCGLNGDAYLELLITAQGNVANVKITTSTTYTALDDAAIQSAKQWHYAPAMKDGVAIPSRTQAVINFRLTSQGSLQCHLPPKQYTGGLPPGFMPVDPPDSPPLQQGEKLLAQDAIRMWPGMTSLAARLHIPAGGETWRINYSVNPASVRVRLVVVTDEQQRDELRGVSPTGAFPLDATVTGRGTQSVSLQSGEYWVVWLFADAPSDRIVSYREIAREN